MYIHVHVHVVLVPMWYDVYALHQIFGHVTMHVHVYVITTGRNCSIIMYTSRD